eukprot:3187081-Ditylum_brightwellii.AAC.1
MGALDVLCLDDEHPMLPTFTQMMCCVPKGIAIVLSGFYRETTSSRGKGKNVWRLTLLNSERLAAELGDKSVPPLTYRSLSILEEMIGLNRNEETWSEYDVEQLNKHYWAVTKAAPDYNHDVSRLTQADGNH